MVSAITETQLLNDPWSLAKSFVDKLDGIHAFSIVLSQAYTGAFMYGRLCVVLSKFYHTGTDYTKGYITKTA